MVYDSRVMISANDKIEFDELMSKYLKKLMMMYCWYCILEYFNIHKSTIVIESYGILSSSSSSSSIHEWMNELSLSIL